MKRSVAIYAGLLVAALVGAYLTWTAEPETEAATGTTVARFDRQNIDTLTWESQQKSLRLEVREDERGRHVWVEVRRSAPSESTASSDRGDREHGKAPAESEAPDVGTDSLAADADRESVSEHADGGEGRSPETTRSTGGSGDAGNGASDGETDRTESYLASDAVEQIFEKLSPLRAERELTVDSEDRRDAYGFDESKGTLTVRTADGTERSFTVGGYAYGRRHVYVRDDSDDQFFVVDAGLVRPFFGPNRRLKQQRVVDTDAHRIERIVVRGDEESAELTHHHPDDPSASYWSLGKGDQKSPTASSWVDKLLRLRLDNFVTDDRPADLRRAAVVELGTSSGPKTELELYRHPGGRAGTEFFAESDFTRRLVRLRRSSASTLFSDLGRLLEGKGGAEGRRQPSSPSPHQKGPRPERRQKGSAPGELPSNRGTGRSPRSPESAPPGD